MSFWDFLYPKKCLGCGRQGKYFCPDCLKTVKLNDQAALNGTSLFCYQGIIKAAVKALKYQFLTDIKSELGELISKNLTDKKLLEFISLRPTVQPMPLYWQRENWRGFNQAKIISEIIADKFALVLINNLKRVQSVRPQADLKRQERLKNVKNIFKLIGRAPKAVLIIDDVWTTGATMKEAMKTFKAVGTKLVWGLTLAR